MLSRLLIRKNFAKMNTIRMFTSQIEENRARITLPAPAFSGMAWH